jgi:hypothetical protein
VIIVCAVPASIEAEGGGDERFERAVIEHQPDYNLAATLLPREITGGTVSFQCREPVSSGVVRRVGRPVADTGR